MKKTLLFSAGAVLGLALILFAGCNNAATEQSTTSQISSVVIVDSSGSSPDLTTFKSSVLTTVQIYLVNQSLAWGTGSAANTITVNPSKTLQNDMIEAFKVSIQTIINMPISGLTGTTSYANGVITITITGAVS